MQRLKASFHNSHHPLFAHLSDRDAGEGRSFKSEAEGDENDIVTSHIQSSTPSFMKDYLAQREKSSESSFTIQRESSSTSVLHRNRSAKSILSNEVSYRKERKSVNAEVDKDTSDDSKDRTGGNSRSDDDGNSVNNVVSSPRGVTDENNTDSKENMTRESENNITDETSVTTGQPSSPKTMDVYLETDDEDNEEEMLKSPREIENKPEQSKTAEDKLDASCELGSDDD